MSAKYDTHFINNFPEKFNSSVNLYCNYLSSFFIPISNKAKEIKSAFSVIT